MVNYTVSNDTKRKIEKVKYYGLRYISSANDRTRNVIQIVQFY